MLKSCSYCNRIHDSKYICGPKRQAIEKQRKRKRQIGQGESIRYTSQMNKKSLEIKEKANFLCEVCFSLGEYNYNNLETHHIEKLIDRPDLALDDNNLICLCRNCHEKAEKEEISKEYLREIIRQRPPQGLEVLIIFFDITTHG